MSITGRYKHYKGNHYEVVGIVIHSETYEELVLYRVVEGSKEYPSGTLWVRPRKMFEETIEIDGVIQPRFEKIS